MEGAGAYGLTSSHSLGFANSLRCAGAILLFVCGICCALELSAVSDCRVCVFCKEIFLFLGMRGTEASSIIHSSDELKANLVIRRNETLNSNLDSYLLFIPRVNMHVPLCSWLDNTPAKSAGQRQQQHQHSMQARHEWNNANGSDAIPKCRQRIG